VPAEVF